MFEPFLNQVSVSGGFPAHLQLRVTSESMSTVLGCGSTNRIGPTGDAERDTEVLVRPSDSHTVSVVEGGGGVKGSSR